MVLGFEHRLTFSACNFVTVQLLVSLLWSGSCTQILIHTSESVFCREMRILEYIYFSCFSPPFSEKPFSIHSYQMCSLFPLFLAAVKYIFFLQGLKFLSGNSQRYMIYNAIRYFVKTDVNHTPLDFGALPL